MPEIKVHAWTRAVITAFFVFSVMLFCLWLANHHNSQEKIFYFWDMKFYHNVVMQSYDNFDRSLKDWLTFLKDWIKNDYNANFTIPLIIPFSFLDHSRHTFILSLVFFYFVPCALLLGVIGREITRQKPIAVFYIVTLIAIISPPAWRPTLFGLPGAGGSALMLAAMYFYFRDYRWQHWWTAPAIGLLIAFSILFRRHFGYAGIAFYGAIFIEGLLYFGLFQRHQRPSERVRQIARLTGYLSVACTVQLLVMWLIAPEFTLRSLLTDYSTVYNSYRRTIAENLQNIREGFGDIAFLMAIAGYLIAWRCRMVAGRLLMFLWLFAGLWLLIWLGIARQATTHVMLHALLPVTVLGNGLAVYGLWRVGSVIARSVSVAMAALIFGIFLHVFIVHDPILSPPIAVLTPLVPTQIIPPQQHAPDYDNYVDLVAYLREQLHDGEQIYVAASSGQFNGELLQSVEESAWNIREDRKVQLLLTTDVDSRDFIPLTQLIEADIVIVTAPVQYHLPPGEQDLVRVVVEAFTGDWEFSHDFVRLERTFSFNIGFTVSIYRRVHPTRIDTSLRTLQRMQQAFQHDQTLPPGSQQNWLFLNRSGLIALAGNASQAGRIVVQPASTDTTPVSLAYFYPLQQPSMLTGQVSSTSACKDVQLSVMIIRPEDNPNESLVDRITLPAGATRSLNVAADRPSAGYLLIQLSSQKQQPAECQIDLSELQVTTAG